MLTPHAPDLWSFSLPHAFMGMQFGARTTVVKVGDRLVLISPVEFDDDTADEIESIGEVAAIVAPNLFHHLFIAPAQKRFPNALLLAPSGLEKKRKDLDIGHHLDVIATPTADVPRKTPPPWDSDLLAIFEIAGQKVVQESVFLHRPSKTLITTDLVLNIKNPKGLLTRTYLKISGYAGEPIHSPLLKLSTWSDKRAGKESLQRVLDQDWDRLILAHGDVVERGGKDALHQAFAWLLAS